MTFRMKKVEKRLTDLSGAFTHIYPDIKLETELRIVEMVCNITSNQLSD